MLDCEPPTTSRDDDDSNERRQHPGVRAARLRLQPATNRRDDVPLFFSSQRTAGFDRVPLRETPATARRRRMLRDEYGMPAHRRLLSIIARRRRRQSFGDERPCMIEHGRQSLGGEIVAISRAQRKPSTKRRLRQSIKEVVEIAHAEHLSCGATARQFPIISATRLVVAYARLRHQARRVSTICVAAAVGTCVVHS